MLIHRRRPLLVCAVLLAALTAAAPARGAYVAETPPARTLYHDGPSGRYLLDGTWLFRLDPTGVGLKEHFNRSTSDVGWTKVTVPNAWNATDTSDASFAGTVGWYRKDFRLPSAAKQLSWVVRFESVNYRSRVWLNGHLVGTNRGAYLPFEIRLPAGLLHRGGVNRLVVRVDDRRYGTDFPPSGLSVTGAPTGGWWNYGGLLREVYLRKIDGLDFNTVQVRPLLPCATCPATIAYRVTVRNYSDKALQAHVAALYGRLHVNLGTRSVGPKQFTTFTKNVRIARPKLWWPYRPYLYNAPLAISVGGRTVQRYALMSGIRSVRVSGDGRLLLNGQALDFRGVGLHEDSERYGFAIDNAIRDQQLAAVRELGATLIRAHYPLHPYTEEQADKLGIMLWSEIPVYAVKTKYLKQRLVRELAARELESNILANQNHPSIIVWSVGNELSAKPGPVQSYYLSRAASAAHVLDPTRPVGYAVAGYPGAGCQAAYGPLDVIGINEYFGWYPGPNGAIADRSILSGYLDGVRACYPHKAIVITEFGAEANRDGPVEERGTYAYQEDFVNYHLGVYATKPWLSGAIYWALQEFRVRPGWQGGNPRPDPPIHEKGLITLDWKRKPAFFDVQRWFKGTQQLRAVSRSRAHHR